MKSRENNYDMLRAVSAIAVILIHVSNLYMEAYMDESVFGIIYMNHILETSLFNILPRFAVPCFVMLSGAFILADGRNEDAVYFYRKTFRSVSIPT